MPFLTATQVAWWLDVSEREVLKREQDGRLKPLLHRRGEPLFSPDIVLPAILEDSNVKFMGGGTLKTCDGPVSFEVIEPTYSLENFGEWCAVFQGRDHCWHVRPWNTIYISMPYALDHFDILLNCEGERAPEIRYEDLPDLYSAHHGFFKTLKRRPGVLRESSSIHVTSPSAAA